LDCSALFTDIKAYGFDDLANSVLFTHLNYAYQDINTIEAWPYLEKKSTGNFAATAAQFTAITDIKQIISLVSVAQGYPLTPMRSDVFYKDYVNSLTLTGNPVIYHTPTVNATAPNGLAVEVWPIPPVSAYQLRYIYIPATLTLTTDIPVLPERFHRILTYGTLLSLYQMEDDMEASARIQQLYDRQLMRMREDLWTQNFDRNDSIADVSGLDNWEGSWY
jgi:hypothetical protein